MATQVAIPLYNKLTNEFDARQQLPASELDEIRNRAFDVFRSKGFPSIREEDWRFTNLVPYLDTSFTTSISGNGNYNLEKAVEENLIPGLENYRVVLVNGSISFELSLLPDSADMSIQPLKKITDTPLFRNNQEFHDHVGGNAMVALNTALFTDGCYFEMSAGKSLDKPLMILHLYTTAENILFQPRHLFVVNKDSKAEIIERSFVLKKDSTTVVNSVSEIVIKENARLTHYHIQSNAKKERWINYTHVTQQSGSRYDNYTCTLPGSDLVRNNLEVSLNGTATEAHLYGLYLVADHQLTDNHTAIHHLYPFCQSNEQYKGIIQENGKAVFNGKVLVAKDAQKTNAYQQNNNLLLSEKALVHAKPQLEIYADDVKCSHGCTVGQFNPDSLFYLRSRGIGEAASRKLLVQAFAFDVTEKFENAVVKKYVQQLLYSKLETAP